MLNESDVFLLSHNESTDHIKSCENMTVVVTGLQIFGDVGKSRQILWILSCTRDVTNLMLCYDILQADTKKKKKDTFNLLFMSFHVLKP